jgi:uncharacterized protein (DUF1778 family)
MGFFDMARPTLPDAKREKIELRVNREQKTVLQAAAKRVGLPTATWIIALALEAARAQTTGADA